MKYDHVKAVAEAIPRTLRPFDFYRRYNELGEFLKDTGTAADSLIAANKRIRNILAKTDVGSTPPDANVMTESAERDLFKALEGQRETFNRQFEDQDYISAMKTLAGLRASIDRFFDEVLVMSEDEAERNNRLALLADIRTLFLKIADFSELNLNQPEAKK